MNKLHNTIIRLYFEKKENWCESDPTLFVAILKNVLNLNFVIQEKNIEKMKKIFFLCISIIFVGSQFSKAQQQQGFGQSKICLFVFTF